MTKLVGQLTLPIIVTFVVGSIIVPLPLALLDFLLAVNLVLSLILLMSTFSIKNVLTLSSFPTILLLAVLFRLSLNISTTRLILDQGKAGEVIEIFGYLITRGNIFVGIILFIVISIVQFIVIAKGSERIAEVSARFALDAMPGRQMSIDAELRSGSISPHQAQEKRAELQNESRFYGALDGAMKFVKGDAIASLIVAVINLVGGILIGVTHHRMEVSIAIQKFCLLTIGDGILAQIPALLNALAAGVLVTRVSTNSEESLSLELPRQLFANSNIRMVCGLLCCFVGFIPGTPHIAFLSIGCIGIISYFFSVSRSLKSPPTNYNVLDFSLPNLIDIKVSKNLFTSTEEAQEFVNSLNFSKDRLFTTEGIIIPPAALSIDSSTNPDCELELSIRGALVKSWAKDSLENLTPTDKAELCNQKIFEYREDFIDDQLTQKLIDIYDKGGLNLSSTLIPEAITLTELTVILRSLVREGISIRNFDIIIQTVAEYLNRVGKGRVLLEEIRIALGRQISAKFNNALGDIEVITIPSSFDLALAEQERNGCLIDLVRLNRFLDFLKQINPISNVVLLTSRGARATLRDYVWSSGNFINILAYEELIAKNIKQFAEYIE
jgi:flagellar biosynthesis component FlhA